MGAKPRQKSMDCLSIIQESTHGEMILDKLQKLYDSEINCKIEWFWDTGVEWYLGDEMNGWKKDGRVDTVTEAIDALWNAAKEKYPNAECFK